MRPAPTEEDVKWVGQQIEGARRQKKTTRAQAAREAGVNDRTWGRVEAGQYESGGPYVPSQITVTKIAEYLGINDGPLLQRLGYDSDYWMLPPGTEIDERGFTTDPIQNGFIREQILMFRRMADELERLLPPEERP